MKKENKGEKTERENRRLQRAMTSYFDIQGFVGIKDDMEMDTKVNLLVAKGVELMKKINDTADSIINEDYSEVCEMLGIPIGKQQYREFVVIMSKIKMDEYSEKNRAKYEEQVKQKMFDQCIREKFLDSVINQFEEKIPVPDWNKNISVNIVTSDDNDFNDVLKRSVEKFINAKNVDEHVLEKCGEAFEYVTNMLYTKKEYKELVEWKYYCGGVPTEKRAPKLFDLFYKFARAYRLAKRFQPDETNELAFEMGLGIDMNEPMPRGEHFAWWAKDMIDRYCPTIKDDYYEWLEER